MPWQALVFLAFVAFAVGGVAALTLGIRGRLVPCEPACAGCGQQVGPVEVEESARCPECGQALDGEDAVRHFRRRRGRGWFALAVAALVATVAIPATISLLVATTAMGRPNQSLPTLLDSLRTGRGDWDWMALIELSNRASSGALTNAELAEASAAVVDAYLAGRSEGSGLFWPVQAGTTIAAAHANGAIGPAVLARMGEAFGDGSTVRLRPRLRAGQTVLLRVETDAVVGSSPAPCFRRTILAVELDGRPLPVHQPGRAAADAPIAITWDRPGTFACAASPGPHTLRLRVRDELWLGVGAAQAGGPDPTAATPAWSAERWLERPVEVMPESAPTIVRGDVDASRRAEVVAACRVLRAAVDRDSRTDRCIGRVRVGITPVQGWTLSFEVFLRIDGVEHRLGTVRAQASQTDPGGGWSSSWNESLQPIELPCPPPGVTSAEVVLRPNFAGEEVEQAVDAIWGEEIVVRDVLVDRNVGGAGR